MAARWRRLSLFPTRELMQGLQVGSRKSGFFGEGCLRHCSENVTLQEKSPTLEVAEESIFLPRKKTWNKLAVLQALASTVKRDITAVHFMFQDDPYLTPRNSAEHRFLSLSKESGENAAKYIINTHPEYFEKDWAEPHIQCLMPEKTVLHPEEVSEVAFQNQIQLRKVKASVNMYDQLLQAGTCISLDTSNSLLDLLCFYGDREPDQENNPGNSSELEEQEETPPERSQFRDSRHAFKFQRITWRKNNNAERIFNLMPEKNAHSYCTMIRGMVKHGAYEKAYGVYTDLLNNRLNADVYTFNALIIAAVEVKDKYTEKWACIEELLKQMAEQDIKPNLLTFNSVLKALRRCGYFGQRIALQTLNEMRTLNIEPSLATFHHFLNIFYKNAKFVKGQPNIYDVLNEIEGKAFYPRDPDDIYFFPGAMKICLELKDVQLAYRLHRVLETAGNRILLEEMIQKNYYYSAFLELMSIMEQLDVLLKWYKELIPSVFFPSVKLMLCLLQAFDSADRLDLIPQIWKDIKQFGFSNRTPIVEEILALLARDKQSPETQVAFADCAEDIKALHEIKDRNTQLAWTATSLNNTTVLFARAGKTTEAWNMLELFKNRCQVPSDLAMKEVLNCIKQSNQADKALAVIKLAAEYGMQSTSTLAKRTLEEFELSEEQRQVLTGVIEGDDDDQ